MGTTKRYSAKTPGTTVEAARPFAGDIAVLVSRDSGTGRPLRETIRLSPLEAVAMIKVLAKAAGVRAELPDNG